MKYAVLFSGGKDSTYAAYLAKNKGYELSCLVSIISENPESYMFHTPSISKVKKQAEVMKIPLLLQNTKGIKEEELHDLEFAIKKAKQKYQIEGVVTGAVKSIYQSSRIQKICDNLGLECFNPLWQKDQLELLNELIENCFDVLIIGVFAYPLNEKWLGRIIDKKFIEEVTALYKRYQINPAGEGGEFETFVLNCPLFEKKLEIKESKILGKRNSWKMEIELD